MKVFYQMSIRYRVRIHVTVSVFLACIAIKWTRLVVGNLSSQGIVLLLFYMKLKKITKVVFFWDSFDISILFCYAVSYFFLEGCLMYEKQTVVWKTIITELYNQIVLCNTSNTFTLLQVLLVVGGQAPKAIRSVECYDFKDERWFPVAEMPTRRCRYCWERERERDY